MMDKREFSKQFAARLRESMLTAGFCSVRTPSGVNLQKLAELTNHSLQICRKYIRGEAIPDPIKLVEIASKLSVSPGWLLFGDKTSTESQDSEYITINSNILHYVFSQAHELYHEHHPSEGIADFLLDLINDLSHMNASEEQSKRIIDLVLSSTRYFAHASQQI